MAAAPEKFGLWDKIYDENVVNALNSNQRWDPKKNELEEELKKLGLLDQGQVYTGSAGSSPTKLSGNESKNNRGSRVSSKRSKKEKLEKQYRTEPNREILQQKLEKVAKEKADQVIEEEEEPPQQINENKVGGAAAVAATATAAAAAAFADRMNWAPTGSSMRTADMEFCLSHTKFDQAQIHYWFNAFRKECPKGRLTKTHLHSLFRKVFPSGDSEAFCNHIFRIFDSDGNQFLDFKEFLMALDVASCRDEREKLEWAFRLYDVDSSGTINLKEIMAIMETMSAVEGNAENDDDEETKEFKAKPLSERAEELFQQLDIDEDGEITMEEFVEGYLRILGFSDGKDPDRLVVRA